MKSETVAITPTPTHADTCPRYGVKTFNVEDGCNVTVTALRNTRRCVALFRPRATCTNLMVTCDKFYLPNEDEARCRQVACRTINEMLRNFLNTCILATIY